MNDLIRRWQSLCMLPAVLLGGCVVMPPPAPPAAAPSHTLSGTRTPLQVGVVYRWQDGNNPLVVLDLAKARVLNDKTGKLMGSDDRTHTLLRSVSLPVGEYEGRCAPGAWAAKAIPRSLCGQRSAVSVDLLATRTMREDMADPYALLELLNRPLSGLVYNQEAELRVVQWRTALAGALGAVPGPALQVCTAQETLLEGVIRVAGKVTRDHALALSTHMAARQGLEIAPGADGADAGSPYTFPVQGKLQTSVVLREITFTQASETPRTDFSLRGPMSVKRGWHDAAAGGMKDF